MPWPLVYLHRLFKGVGGKFQPFYGRAKFSRDTFGFFLYGD